MGKKLLQMKTGLLLGMSTCWGLQLRLFRPSHIKTSAGKAQGHSKAPTPPALGVELLD